MKQKSLLKPRSHRFLHDCNLSKHVPVAFATFFATEIENAGNTGKLSLKTRSHCKKCTKTPLNSLKTMPRAWKMVPQSDSLMGEHFSGALVDFPWQTEVK